MKLFFRVFILLSMMALPLMVSAQQAQTMTEDLGHGTTIEVPLNWHSKKASDGTYTLGDSQSTITLTAITPDHLHTLGVNFAPSSNVVDVVINLATLFDGAEPDRADVQKTRYDARTVAVYLPSNDKNDQLDVALTMSDGTFGYLSFVVPKGQLTTLRQQIDTIIASYDSVTAAGAATEEASTSQAGIAGSTSGGAATGGSSGSAQVICTVSADSANSAQLRVGPGTNRGAIAFLPAKVDVTVTGRIELKDGSVWYQLDKTQAAPHGTAASQLWVAASDVFATGNCDQVGDTSAPPVVPGHVAPQPTPVGGSGGTTTTPGGAGNAGPGTLPAEGAWVMILNTTTNGSCRGTNNFIMQTTEIFNPTTYGETDVNKDKDSFYFDSDVFTRVPGSNSFNGTFTYNDGTLAQVHFDLASTTTMTGQIVANYSIQGTDCSETVQFVANHG